RGDHARPGDAVMVVIGTIAVVAVTIAIGLYVDRKVRPPDAEPGAPKKLASHAAGEAPATAFRAGAVQLGRIRAGQRCRSCRTPMQHEPDERVRFDDRDLLVLSFRCPRCATRRALYVEATRTSS